jgi:ubiquinone/menaquinone biosynthesis C-methylase UbiE
VRTNPEPPPLTGTQRLYDRLAPGYHRWWLPVIEPASLRLLDLAAPAIDGRHEPTLVDVGSGTGPLCRAAVLRWPTLRAVAVEPSSGMRVVGQAEAEASLDRSVRERISWLTGVAERLPVDDRSADAVVSSFAYQYLGNRSAALREAYRALRPGGVVAVVTWLDSDRSFAPWRLLREVLDELGIVRPPSSETALFRSLPSAAALVRRAGFRGVRANAGTVEYQWTLDSLLRCSESEDAELRESLDAETLRTLDRLWRERLARLTEGELHYRDDVAYVTGYRPA